jgi:hypothetical protein
MILDRRPPPTVTLDPRSSALARGSGYVTGLAGVFMDGADVARIFDQLRPLFDRGFLVPPAVRTWPLEDSAEAYSDCAERVGRH